ncbi:hypothetical protein ACFQVA_24305 [Actinomadura keratinilytica]
MTSSAPPEQEPLVLDPTGADPHAEHRALHARGPATRVDVLGVPAWSVSDPALLKTLLTSPDVSKDGRAHWPPSPRPCRAGRLRSGSRYATCSPRTAPTTGGCAASSRLPSAPAGSRRCGPWWSGSPPGCSTSWPLCRRTRPSTCARSWRTRCPSPSSAT